MPPELSDVASNGFTPLHRPEPVVDEAPLPDAPVTTVKPPNPAIQWQLPDVKNILESGSAPEVNEEFIQQRARLIQETLASFGAPVQVVEINRGPAITQFGVEPLFVETSSGRTKVRVNKIASLADDLALALAAPRIRIQAPVPGHSYVGIEVPNDEMTLVALRDIVESEPFQRNTNPMKFALGRDVTGHPVSTTLENMPHLLIAGTTGSGKSVCVNSILTCMLLHNTPDELKLILVDPKRVELTGYNGIPHLLAPVVVEVERVIGALQWMTREMDRRYHLFAQIGSRNINDYNARMKLQGQKKLPLLVIVIDELADLMMISPTETEQTITRLAQLARATGIHMVLATQRPSVDVVTGLIKANFPARIAFAVASNTDSRVILDQPGAERLLGTRRHALPGAGRARPGPFAGCVRLGPRDPEPRGILEGTSWGRKPVWRRRPCLRRSLTRARRSNRPPCSRIWKPWIRTLTPCWPRRSTSSAGRDAPPSPCCRGGCASAIPAPRAWWT
jgi:DNA segregation ATPase FtsK/SpoIIIE, S-DNA-T family